MAQRTDPPRTPASSRSIGGEVGADRPWWNPGARIAQLPEELQGIADRVEVRLWAEARRAEAASLPPEFDLTSARAIIDALRETIHEADRRAPEETVRSLHARLDLEFLGLAQALLDRTVADSLQLLQDVSHDIRSPLNSILFLADTLFSERAGKLNEVQKRQIGVLYTASVTLVGLVNDLIDSARLGGGLAIPVSNVAFSIESALNDVQSLVGPLATHRSANLRFHLETVGPRSGDRRLLSRVLINLVTNALQAVDEGGRVEVRVSEPQPGWMRVEVGDDGPGEDVERLREILADRSGDSNPLRRIRGWTHGLGLTISLRLVQSAGGTLDVESVPGEGTTFVLDLPFPRSV